MFDDELQQDETFARIAIAAAGFDMNMQLVVGIDELEVVETGQVGQAYTRRDN